MQLVDDFMETLSGLLSQSVYRWALLIAAIAMLAYAWAGVMSFFPR